MGQLLVDLFFMRDARLTFEFTPDRRGVRSALLTGDRVVRSGAFELINFNGSHQTIQKN